MDELEQTQPEREEKPKTAWQQTKESWYDKIPLTVKQLDIILWICYISLAVVFIKIFIDAGIIG